MALIAGSTLNEVKHARTSFGATHFFPAIAAHGSEALLANCSAPANAVRATTTRDVASIALVVETVYATAWPAVRVVPKAAARRIYGRIVNAARAAPKFLAGSEPHADNGRSMIVGLLSRESERAMRNGETTGSVESRHCLC